MNTEPELLGFARTTARRVSVWRAWGDIYVASYRAAQRHGEFRAERRAPHAIVQAAQDPGSFYRRTVDWTDA